MNSKPSTVANQEYLRKLYRNDINDGTIFDSRTFKEMNYLSLDSKVSAVCTRLDSLQDQIRGDLGDNRLHW